MKGGTGAVHRYRFKGKVNCDIDQVLLLHVTCVHVCMLYSEEEATVGDAPP